RTPDRFPSLNVVQLDGSRSRRLATRYGGSTSGVSSTVIVFDQQELRRNVGLFSDLFVLDRIRGKARALTSRARLPDPDLAPDQQSIVCVREGGGHRDLVLLKVRPTDVTGDASSFRLEASGLRVLASDADAEFNAPRWSPDGRSIAVERHRRGALSEIVVMDLATMETRSVAAIENARVVTPAWRPDGLAIVGAADIGGGPFNLFEFPLDSGTPRRLTSVTGGATWPDVSP